MILSPSSKRNGFSLLETLIVVAIIAIVAGMVLGMYWKVHEASTRINCVCRTRSIGIAIFNYQSSALQYPTGQGKNNTTLFWSIRDQMGLGATTGGDALAVYLCPNRRSPASVHPGQTPADYGWSDDPNSILGSSVPVLPNEISDKTPHTILLGHIGIQPRDYGGGAWDGPWKSNPGAFARTPAPLYRDAEVPDSTNYMGSPHPSAVPHAFADGSVKTIDYDVDPEWLTQAWIYNRRAPIPDIGNE